jgi:hypothetical protein
MPVDGIGNRFDCLAFPRALHNIHADPVRQTADCRHQRRPVPDRVVKADLVQVRAERLQFGQSGQRPYLHIG